jgi:hypothetical protein
MRRRRTFEEMHPALLIVIGLLGPVITACLFRGVFALLTWAAVNDPLMQQGYVHLRSSTELWWQAGSWSLILWLVGLPVFVGGVSLRKRHHNDSKQNNTSALWPHKHAQIPE